MPYTERHRLKSKAARILCEYTTGQRAALAALAVSAGHSLPKEFLEKLPLFSGGWRIDHAVEGFKVSRTSIERARYVLERDERLFAEMLMGRVSPHEAKNLVKARDMLASSDQFVVAVRKAVMGLGG